MVASVNGVFEDSLSLPKIVEGGKVDDVFDCWIFDIEFTERGCVEETAEGRGLKPSYIVERERETGTKLRLAGSSLKERWEPRLSCETSRNSLRSILSQLCSAREGHRHG
jgi:hypothetical protein